MRASTIFFVQIAFTTVAYAAIYRFLLAEHLRRLPARTAIALLFIPQLFRHLGFSALSPELVEPPQFSEYTGTAFAVGDGVLIALSYAAIVLLARRSRAALAVCWIFVLAAVGHDLFVSYTLQSTPQGVLDQFGGHYYAATFFIPSLVVTHALIFVHLMWRGHELP